MSAKLEYNLIMGLKKTNNEENDNRVEGGGIEGSRVSSPRNHPLNATRPRVDVTSVT
jgi:hypothetical protein